MKLTPILQKIEDLGYKIGTEIGRGSNSVVYNLDKGKILKVTTDNEVAFGAFKLLNKKFKNVYRVFRVLTPKKKIDPRKYYIIAEKLDHPNEEDNWDTLYQFVREYDKYKNYDLTEEIMKKCNSKEVQKAISLYSKEDVAFLSFAYIAEFWSEVIDNFFDFDKKFDKNYKQYTDLLNGVKELKSAGIVHYDIHFENIMKRGNNFVLIDVQDTKFEPIELIENKNLIEMKIQYARTPEAKYRGLRNIKREDWAGMMVFESVGEGDVFVGKDCLFDIRIAFLDMTFKVLSVGIIKKDTGRVIAPKGTAIAIETAADDKYEFIQGAYFKIPSPVFSFQMFLPHSNFGRYS